VCDKRIDFSQDVGLVRQKHVVICTRQFNDARSRHSGQEAFLVSLDVDHRSGFERLDCGALLEVFWYIVPKRIVR